MCTTEGEKRASELGLIGNLGVTWYGDLWRVEVPVRNKEPTDFLAELKCLPSVCCASAWPIGVLGLSVAFVIHRMLKCKEEFGTKLNVQEH
jgi:hypothetical protein